MRVVRSFSHLLLATFILAMSGLAWEKAIPTERAVPALEAVLQVLAEAGLGPGRAAQLGIPVRDQKLQVVVEATHLAEGAVLALGGAVLHCAPELGLWEVLVDPEGLVALAQLPGVRYVRRPHRPELLETQGVVLIGASAWHAAGLTGQGIRVAVIDMEFGGVSQALARGRLRHVVATLDYTGEGFEVGGGHGTACAEIVQDMAPEAELVLMKIANEVQLARAVEDATRLGVRVITHSAAWFNTSFYDGTGVVCEIVKRATDAGILWVNAVGNFAAGAHWEGAWSDYDGDGLLEFAPGENINMFTPEPLSSLGFWLTWDDWPSSDQDLDLYIVDVRTGQVVASSTNTQVGAQPPAEHVFFVPTFPSTYGVVIQGYRVTRPVQVELFASTSVKLSRSLARSSVPSPADAPFVLSVGAIPWRNWTTGPQGPYSSQGPTNSSRWNHAQHIKPDLMGPDGVDTFTLGINAFVGTSAAAPHAAGAAALVWSAHPHWTAEQVRFWLEFTAVDLGLPGKDNIYGQGRLRLPPPAVPSPPSQATHTYGASGWHLVSVPTVGDNAGIFGTTLWHWNGRYYEALDVSASVNPLLGYWANFPSPRTVRAGGTVPTADQTLVLDRPGWHLVSAPWSYTKGALQLVWAGQQRSWNEAVAAGWVRDTLWGYDPGARRYSPAETLEPWQGYWLYVHVSQVALRFLYAARGGSLGRSTALSSGEPPPAPPAESSRSEPQFLIMPNPWSGDTPVRFRVVSPEPVTALTIQVFDLSGRLVWEGTVAGEDLGWPGIDDRGNPLANGVYLCVFMASLGEERAYSGSLKLVILR